MVLSDEEKAAYDELAMKLFTHPLWAETCKLRDITWINKPSFDAPDQTYQAYLAGVLEQLLPVGWACWEDRDGDGWNVASDILEGVATNGTVYRGRTPAIARGIALLATWDAEAGEVEIIRRGASELRREAEKALDELVRMTEDMGLYDAEFANQHWKQAAAITEAVKSAPSHEQRMLLPEREEDMLFELGSLLELKGEWTFEREKSGIWFVEGPEQHRISFIDPVLSNIRVPSFFVRFTGMSGQVIDERLPALKAVLAELREEFLRRA